MTQAEYRKEIDNYKERIKQLEKNLDEAYFNKADYDRVLKDYYEVSSMLEKERQYNINNTATIQEQREIIEQYKAMISRITFKRRVNI